MLHSNSQLTWCFNKVLKPNIPIATQLGSNTIPRARTSHDNVRYALFNISTPLLNKCFGNTQTKKYNSICVFGPNSSTKGSSSQVSHPATAQQRGTFQMRIYISHFSAIGSRQENTIGGDSFSFFISSGERVGKEKGREAERNRLINCRKGNYTAFIWERVIAFFGLFREGTRKGIWRYVVRSTSVKKYVTMEYIHKTAFCSMFGSNNVLINFFLKKRHYIVETLMLRSGNVSQIQEPKLSSLNLGWRGAERGTITMQ